MFLPENYRLLKDEEEIPKDCLCFGSIGSGKIGWGKPPPNLIGQYFCDGSPRHPDFIAIKK